MRVAVFSDVHGNYSALKAVRDHMVSNSDFDLLVFAGDACLAGPRPLDCLNLIQEMEPISLVGNTDAWILEPPGYSDEMDADARQNRERLREFCLWTAAKMNSDAMGWLNNLSRSFDFRVNPGTGPETELFICHANPKDLLQIIFPSIPRQLALYDEVRQDDKSLEPLFHGIEQKTVAFGHLHIPGIRHWRDKTLINISSVSHPGDGRPEAKYAVLSWQIDSGWSTSFRLVPYSIADEISAYKRAKPPVWREHIEQLETLGYIAQIV